MKPDYPYTNMPIRDKYKRWLACPNRTKSMHFYMLERVLFCYIWVLHWTVYILGIITVPVWGLPYYLIRTIFDYITARKEN